jgi:hypothetical protein
MFGIDEFHASEYLALLDGMSQSSLTCIANVVVKDSDAGECLALLDGIDGISQCNNGACITNGGVNESLALCELLQVNLLKLFGDLALVDGCAFLFSLSCSPSLEFRSWGRMDALQREVDGIALHRMHRHVLAVKAHNRWLLWMMAATTRRGRCRRRRHW